MSTKINQQTSCTSPVLYRHVISVLYTILSMVMVTAVFMSCVGLSLALVVRPFE